MKYETNIKLILLYLFLSTSLTLIMNIINCNAINPFPPGLFQIIDFCSFKISTNFKRE